MQPVNESTRPSLGANYRRVWSSSALSNLADGIFVVALPLMAVQLTDSPALVAGVVFVGRLPWLIFVLFAGALADRVDRRATMRNVELLRVAVIAVLLVLGISGRLELVSLYIAAFVLGVGETLYDTAAQSILPSLVPRELLSRANGRLYAVEVITNQFVGPPLGGLLVAISVPLALTGSVAAYGLAVVGLVLLRGTFRPERSGPPTSILRDVRDGLSYLWGQSVIRAMALMVGVMNLAGTATQAILVLFALDAAHMGLDEIGFGILMTGFAIGAVLGSVATERVERWLGRSRTLFMCVTAIAVATLIPALTAQPLAVAVSLVVTGMMGMIWNVITVSLRQRIAPDEMLGRVNAGYRLFAWGTMPLGALLGGLLAQLFGFQMVWLVAALMTFALLAFRPLLTDRAIEAAERPAVEAEQASAAAS